MLKIIVLNPSMRVSAVGDNQLLSRIVVCGPKTPRMTRRLRQPSECGLITLQIGLGGTKMMVPSAVSGLRYIAPGKVRVPRLREEGSSTRGYFERPFQ